MMKPLLPFMPSRGDTAAVPALACGHDHGPRIGTAAPGGRLKLWEIDPGSHCSIIGTCFSLDDLRRLIRKAELNIPVDADDYDIHGYFVLRAAKRAPLAKLMHKALDRKYPTQITRFHKCSKPEEIWSLWTESLASGDVAGAYWALMTSGATPEKMRIRAYNEVHMLSHLMGKSSRGDLKRLHQLEAGCAELTDRLSKTRAQAAATLGERDERIRKLEAELAQARIKSTEPTPVIEGRKTGLELERLKMRFEILERRLKTERARARAAEERAEALLAAASQTKTLVDTFDDLETEEGDAEPALDGKTNLEGCALLYVGGHRSVTPRLRAHVEQMHGRFLYHEGGVEAQNGRLPGLVSQADAVFCPIVCVSHDACLRLKHLCKRHGKRFIPLRSTGVSGFLSAVAAMSSE